ncbi:MAG TPA: 5-oxoprolinase subunit PxpB [Candidatus Saccharimonadales bacterium]|nr:5-oxoprolinase subunit PxpB [Candidatus Saccharimonadales bacterium]
MTLQVVVDPFGAAALLVRLPDQASVHALAAGLVHDLSAGDLVDVVPGDRTILVRFDGTDAGETVARRRVGEISAASDRLMAPRPRRHIVPVSYGGEHGPDLAEAAAIAGITPARLVELHAGRDHTVGFLGFAPGFAYLGDVDPAIVVPRLAVPRTSTPAGSVAIAERYTGIYPADLPGGWRVIGRTPLTMFDPAASPPTTLLPGDVVRFVAEGGGPVP